MKLKTKLFFLSIISAVIFTTFSINAQSQSDTLTRFDFSKVQTAIAGKAGNSGSNQVGLPKTPSITAVILKMIFWLAVVLFLLAGAVYVFRKFASYGKKIGSRSSNLDILETAGIMPGKTLSLVRVADKVLLLGISQDTITCLTEFSGERALEMIQTTGKENAPKAVMQFSESLNFFMEKFKK